MEKYVELLPTIKQRTSLRSKKGCRRAHVPGNQQVTGVYSICSSSDFRPGKCQLLVVREDWQAKGLLLLVLEHVL